MNNALPNFDELKRLRSMGRRMNAFYTRADVLAERLTRELPVSCKPGCAGCCHLLVLASLPEAIAIAEHFLSDVSRRQLIPLLMQSFYAQLQHLDGERFETVRTAYFAKKVPCTFLDQKTNQCTIYSVRPTACRYHMVVSDPAACAPGTVATVHRVDSMRFDAEALSEANKVSNQTRMPLYIAPLPVVMLWAFKLLIEGRSAFDAALKDEDLGVMNLNGWIDRLRAGEAAVAAEK